VTFYNAAGQEVGSDQTVGLDELPAEQVRGRRVADADDRRAPGRIARHPIITDQAFD